MRKEIAILEMLLEKQNKLKEIPWYSFKELIKIKKQITKLQNYVIRHF